MTARDVSQITAPAPPPGYTVIHPAKWLTFCQLSEYAPCEYHEVCRRKSVLELKKIGLRAQLEEELW